jgi:hypothetical protein
MKTKQRRGEGERMKPNKDAAKEKQGEPSETDNETQTEADEREPQTKPIVKTKQRRGEGETNETK